MCVFVSFNLNLVVGIVDKTFVDAPGSSKQKSGKINCVQYHYIQFRGGTVIVQSLSCQYFEMVLRYKRILSFDGDGFIF